MSKKISVSDHAVLRWLERVHEIDIEFFRNQIRNIVGPPMKVKATSITVDGFCYVFDPETRTVITVREHGAKIKNRRKIDDSK